MRYLIPKRITQRYEFMPGWGFPEVGLVLGGFAAGIALYLLLGLFGLPLALRIFLAILIALAAFAAANPVAIGQRPIDLITDWRGWTKTQRLYMYDLGRDDT